MSKTIAITGGGTAGHIMPSVALLPELKKEFDKIIYIGSHNGQEKKIANDLKIPFFEIDTVKFARGKVLSNFKIPSILLRSVKQSKKILKEQNVDVVFSKGGYVGLPVVIASKKAKVPAIIHESDTTLGLANKVSLRYAKKLITSHPTTKAKDKKTIYCGNPIREEIFNGNADNVRKLINSNKKIILVIGGSLGAKAINELIINSLDNLTKDYYIIHIIGKGNTIIKHDNYLAMEYTNNIWDYYNAADIIISRAGASAVTEIMALRKKTIFIPLVHGSRGDQVDNAKRANNYNSVAVINEDTANENELMFAISMLGVNDPRPYYRYDKNIPKKIVSQICKTIED